MLVSKKIRFNELLKALKPISSKTLSSKLKEMISYEIIKKEITSTMPVVAFYSLTEKGAELSKVLDSMAEWSSKWSK